MFLLNTIVSVVFYVFMGALGFVAGHALSDELKIPSERGKITLAIGTGLFWPVSLVCGAVWCLYKSPGLVSLIGRSAKYLAGGVSDIRRAKQIKSLPSARVVVTKDL